MTCDDDSGQLEFQGTTFEIVGGDAITASHVVSGCGAGAPIDLGEPSASVLQNDPTHDLALLFVGPEEFGYQPPALEPDKARPYVGEQVAMLGIKGGADRQTNISLGPVIGVGKTATLSSPDGLHETLSDAIVVAASGVLPGESGGPAIDATGKLVGVIEGTGRGLVELTPVADLPSSSGPGESLPVLIVGSWVGIKPAQLDARGPRILRGHRIHARQPGYPRYPEINRYIN